MGMGMVGVAQARWVWLRQGGCGFAKMGIGLYG